MFIEEFYARFISTHERSRLFKAIRRVSRLEAQALLPEEVIGWHEWPHFGPEGPGMQKA